MYYVKSWEKFPKQFWIFNKYFTKIETDFPSLLQYYLTLLYHDESFILIDFLLIDFLEKFLPWKNIKSEMLSYLVSLTL